MRSRLAGMAWANVLAGVVFIVYAVVLRLRGTGDGLSPWLLVLGIGLVVQGAVGFVIRRRHPDRWDLQ